MDGIIALPVAVVYHQENHYEDNKRILLTTRRYNIRKEYGSFATTCRQQKHTTEVIRAVSSSKFGSIVCIGVLYFHYRTTLSTTAATRLFHRHVRWQH
jgi:hypothetical protein